MFAFAIATRVITNNNVEAFISLNLYLFVYKNRKMNRLYTLKIKTR